MWDVSPKIANERVKGLSGICYNLSAALLAAVAARFYNDGIVTWPPISWIAIAGLLIWAATQLLSLLQMED